MPLAPEEQVPKPLTYTLMYHFLWCVMFLLSAAVLTIVFLVSGQPLGRAVLSPLGLVFFALVAGAGALATYAVRVQVLLGALGLAAAFRRSAASSWAVLLFAPAALAVWRFAAEPLARSLWNGGQPWSVPAQITAAMIQVEVILWWLSHLLSVRGLARGRKKYLAPAAPSGAKAASRGPEPPTREQ